MKFYTTLHKYYCGIDLHARILYVCILDQQGNKLVHQKIGDDPLALLRLLEPYIGDVVVGFECMHCWYWVSDFCQNHEIDFVLGHVLYMKAIHGGKAKNDKINSYKIASLLKGGNFPLAYNYPKARGQPVIYSTEELMWLGTLLALKLMWSIPTVNIIYLVVILI